LKEQQQQQQQSDAGVAMKLESDKSANSDHKLTGFNTSRLLGIRADATIAKVTSSIVPVLTPIVAPTTAAAEPIVIVPTPLPPPPLSSSSSSSASLATSSTTTTTTTTATPVASSMPIANTPTTTLFVPGQPILLRAPIQPAQQQPAAQRPSHFGFQPPPPPPTTTTTTATFPTTTPSEQTLQ
jgi:hypothetical protein